MIIYLSKEVIAFLEQGVIKRDAYGVKTYVTLQGDFKEVNKQGLYKHTPNKHYPKTKFGGMKGDYK